MTLWSFVKKVDPMEMPDGFSFTGQASLSPTMDLSKSLSRKKKIRDDDSYDEDKRPNLSKVYSSLAQATVNKAPVGPRKGYQKGTTC
ncbi:MAG TPA: hypothetical protein VER35_01120 [Candidatus Limnocylindrales bacterium]|nr:hypothetical protein [Candidatus Limnocylindrales bacterium]